MKILITSFIVIILFICQFNAGHLRECKPPRCLESELAEPIFLQQQMNNLLNTTFAGEARHNNPSHCLAFYNDTPEDHYASVEARSKNALIFTFEMIKKYFTYRIVADIWNYIVRFFKGEEQPYPISSFFKEGEIPDKPDCCWTANNNSILPTHLKDVVTVYPTGEV